MQKYIFIGLMSLIGCQDCRHTPPPAGPQVYVIMGQSVAGGYFDTPQLDQTDKRLLMYKNHQWQLAQEPTLGDGASVYTSGVSFGKNMLGHNPSTPIGLINCARGSTTIDEWLPGSCSNPNLPVCGMFETCEATVHEALASYPDAQVAGVLINQGQSDAYECSGYWSAFFPQWVSAIDSTYGDIPVVFSQLGYMASVPCPAGYLDSFRARQSQIRANKTYMVNTMDLNTTDGVHMDTPGHVIEGQRWAAAMSTANSNVVCTDKWYTRLLPK